MIDNIFLPYASDAMHLALLAERLDESQYGTGFIVKVLDEVRYLALQAIAIVEEGSNIHSEESDFQKIFKEIKSRQIRMESLDYLIQKSAASALAILYSGHKCKVDEEADVETWEMTKMSIRRLLVHNAGVLTCQACEKSVRVTADQVLGPVRRKFQGARNLTVSLVIGEGISANLKLLLQEVEAAMGYKFYKKIEKQWLEKRIAAIKEAQKKGKASNEDYAVLLQNILVAWYGNEIFDGVKVDCLDYAISPRTAQWFRESFLGLIPQHLALSFFYAMALKMPTSAEGIPDFEVWKKTTQDSHVKEE